MEKIIEMYENNQELINALCREYEDFIGFDLDKITHNEYAYDTLYKFSGKVAALIGHFEMVQNRKWGGKYYLICCETHSVMIPEDPEKRFDLDIRSFKYIAKTEEKTMCYIVDLDCNTLEKADAKAIAELL